MDRKLSDEQLDRIAKTLLKDFSPKDETLDEIAGSPRLWWNVRNRIETEKSRREKSWLTVFRPRKLVFGALAILICCGLAVLVLNFRNDSNAGAAQQHSLQNPVEEIAQTPEALPLVSPKIDSKIPEIAKNPAAEKVPVKTVEPKTRFAAKNRNIENSAKRVGRWSKREVPSKNETEETKTDFIALSYAAATDSGQIVRVKVPSSMMVSLGVKTNVEKESELVNAEVVIGDDGLARAIRFIR